MVALPFLWIVAAVLLLFRPVTVLQVSRPIFGIRHRSSRREPRCLAASSDDDGANYSKEEDDDEDVSEERDWRAFRARLVQQDLSSSSS